jgi:hypothetical protein
MQGVLKHVAVVLGICAACWLAVLMRWQMQSHDATEADVVKFMVLMPLFCIAVVYAVRWAWNKQNLSVSAAAGASNASTAPVAQAVVGLDDAFRKARFQIVAFSASCGAANELNDLVEAVTSGKPLPQPDESLVKSDGLPVMCARNARLKDGEWPEILEQVLQDALTSKEDWGNNNTELPTAVMRALSLSIAHFESLASAIAQLPEIAMPRTVRVLLGVSPDWSELERVIYTALANAIIKEGVDSESNSLKFDISVVPGTASDLWQKADQVLIALKREKRADLVALVACESLVDQGTVDVLDGAGKLLDPDSRSWGIIPGEASAMLLLANEEASELFAKDPEKPTKWLSRLSIIKREKSIDLPGKVSNVAMGQAVQALQIANNQDLKKIQLFVSDGDQHSARAGELFGWAIEHCPDLDPGQDIKVLGRVAGSMGLAGSLVAVAAAAQSLNEQVICALVLGQQDQFIRLAAFVSIDPLSNETLGK